LSEKNHGGLIILKICHHFNLINWWLEAEPETAVGLLAN
jgi:predicted dehydrogenase